MRAREIIQEAESESAFEQRCLAIVRKVAQYASPADREIMNSVEVLITNDPDADDRVYSSPEDRVVVVDMEEFGPAPTSVLIWLIAHELCHIVMNHKSSKTISAQASQQQEQSADKYANELMLKLGITKVPVFSWLYRRKDQLGRTELERRQALERDPANAGYFNNSASHPTTDQRIKQAGELGLELSRVNTDQIDSLIGHMA